MEEKFYIAAPFVLLPLLKLKDRRLQYCALLWRDRARLRWITDPGGAQTLFWAGAGVIGWLWLRSPPT